MENIDFKALFNSPEPDTIEQQKSQPPYVYHCGIQQLEKNFEEAEKKSRVPAHDIHNYTAGSRRKVYGWEITAVKEYPRTVTLAELGIKRAPQSWQYYKTRYIKGEIK